MHNRMLSIFVAGAFATALGSLAATTTSAGAKPLTEAEAEKVEKETEAN